MALNMVVRFRTRRECLEQLARTIGEHPPRQPIPLWWTAFEGWYDRIRSQEDLRDPDDPACTSLSMRLEAFTHEEDDEDDLFQE